MEHWLTQKNFLHNKKNKMDLSKLKWWQWLLLIFIIYVVINGIFVIVNGKTLLEAEQKQREKENENWERIKQQSQEEALANYM